MEPMPHEPDALRRLLGEAGSGPRALSERSEPAPLGAPEPTNGRDHPLVGALRQGQFQLHRIQAELAELRRQGRIEAVRFRRTLLLATLLHATGCAALAGALLMAVRASGLWHGP